MKNAEKNSVSEMVKRLRDLKDCPEKNFNPPAWMLDESRTGKDSLTADEQHEWAECVCKSMRSIVAMTYLIKCAERWGLLDGERVFKCGATTLGLTQELIENIIAVHVEAALIERQPEERYLAVFRFYQADDQRREREGYSWFCDFLDDLLINVANKLINGETPQQPTFH